MDRPCQSTFLGVPTFTDRSVAHMDRTSFRIARARPSLSERGLWRSVAGDLVSVDVQDLSGDERRRLQEEDPFDDVADPTDASERPEPGERGVQLRRMLRRLDDARRD